MRRSLVGSPISTSNTRIPAGTIAIWPGSTAPKGWLLCDGSLYGAFVYPELYRVIENNFGNVMIAGDFYVPDFRNRVPYGAFFLSVLGQTGGTTTETLTAAQSATKDHTHSYNDAYNDTGVNTCNASSGAGSNWNQATASESTSTESANASQSHTNLQPYIILNFIIKT